MTTFDDDLDVLPPTKEPTKEPPVKPVAAPVTGPVTLSAKQLQDIVASAVTAAVAATKTPSVLEQRKLDAEQKDLEERQRDRKENAAGVLAQRKIKSDMQHVCSHKHRNGNSHGVYIQERSGPGYILCQKNQCIIRPGVEPKEYKGTDLYDTNLFNRLFQELPSSEMFQ